MVKIIGAFIAVFFTYVALYLSSVAAGYTFNAYLDPISFFICFGIPYGCALAAYGKVLPDLDGMELMNKLFMPVAWLGTLIGWVVMLYNLGTDGLIENENFIRLLSFSTAISVITLLYGLILKVIFTTLIASKK
tara:strand:+ start:738 stop:1139 length:402 start_codon:yes stop_codon:yes gene_type:complete